MIHDTIRSSRRFPLTRSGWSLITWLVIGVGCTVGCEKLSWPTSKPASSTPPAQETTSPLAVRPAVPPNEVVAKVNDTVISKRDVEFALQELKATTEALGQTWKLLPTKQVENQYDLTDLVNDLVMADLRSQDALARGLDRNPDVQRLLAYRHRTFFAQEWIRWQLERITATQEEIDQFYKANQLGYREPEQIRVRQLVVASEDQAKATLVKLLEGADFVEIAKQNSLSLDDAQGPLVEKWVMRSADKAIFAPNNEKIRTLLDAVLEQAAFAIDKVGGPSSYVKGPDGKFHIFQLVEKKAGRQKSLVEVSDDIRNGLRLRKLYAVTEELRTKGRVATFPERLEGIAQ